MVTFPALHTSEALEGLSGAPPEQDECGSPCATLHTGSLVGLGEVVAQMTAK